ncbi:MAG: hypothetical protein LBG76_01450 [Treponema sp.]|nr:hypothetical protein [Treponema sp.]
MPQPETSEIFAILVDKEKEAGEEVKYTEKEDTVKYISNNPTKVQYTDRGLVYTKLEEKDGKTYIYTYEYKYAVLMNLYNYSALPYRPDLAIWVSSNGLAINNSWKKDVWAWPTLPTVTSITLRDKKNDTTGNIAAGSDFSFSINPTTPTAYIENTEIVVTGLKPPYKYTFTINAISDRYDDNDNDYVRVVLYEKSVTPGFNNGQFQYSFENRNTEEPESLTIDFGCVANKPGENKNGSVKDPVAWSEFEGKAEIELIVTYEIVGNVGSLQPYQGNNSDKSYDTIMLPLRSGNVDATNPANRSSVYGLKLSNLQQ